MKKNLRMFLFATLLVFSIALVLTSCRSGNTGTTGKSAGKAANAAEATSTGQPDKLAINQVITRSADWVRIVRDSPFRVGTTRDTGNSETTKDYSIPILEMDYGTYPRIDGSTVAVPMLVEFARQHLGLNDEDARMFSNVTTTANAYKNLIEQKNGPSQRYSRYTWMKQSHIDIIIVTEPSDEELKLATSESSQMIVKPVCYDSFVFITHKDNPVESLTVEQVRKIYSGEITNWKDVGGNDEAIAAYQREANSGSQTTMENKVMNGIALASPINIKIVTNMGDLIERVAEYQNDTKSIGYTFKYYIDTLYKNDNIKILKINGIQPDTATMRDGSYPFTSNYFSVIRADDINNNGGKFQEWLLSDEGQRCIGQAGYCPLISGGVNAITNIATIEPFELTDGVYTSGENIIVHYPQIVKVNDKEMQDSVNELIRNEALKILDAYKNETGVYLDINYSIMFNSKDLISIRYLGTANYQGAARPTDLFYTTNIDVKKRIKIQLADILNVNKSFIDAMIAGKYVKYRSDLDIEAQGLMNKIFDGSNNFILIVYLNRADSTRGGYLNGTCSYFTQDRLGVSFGVSYALGSHVEFEILYSDILNNFYKQDTLF